MKKDISVNLYNKCLNFCRGALQYELNNFCYHGNILYNIQIVTQRINSEVYIQVLNKPVNNPLGVSLVRGIREPHEVKKISFDLGGKRTHDLRIRSTVTLPTELRGRTEKSGLFRCESRRRESKGTYECCAA